jgi:hypothetical protein
MLSNRVTETECLPKTRFLFALSFFMNLDNYIINCVTHTLL